MAFILKKHKARHKILNPVGCQWLYLDAGGKENKRKVEIMA